MRLIVGRPKSTDDDIVYIWVNEDLCHTQIRVCINGGPPHTVLQINRDGTVSSFLQNLPQGLTAGAGS